MAKPTKAQREALKLVANSNGECHRPDDGPGTGVRRDVWARCHKLGWLEQCDPNGVFARLTPAGREALGLPPEEQVDPPAEQADPYADYTLEQFQEEVDACPAGCHAAGDRETEAGCRAILAERDRHRARAQELAGDDGAAATAAEGPSTETALQAAATLREVLPLVGDGPGQLSPDEARAAVAELTETASSGEEKPEAEAEGVEGEAPEEPEQSTALAVAEPLPPLDLMTLGEPDQRTEATRQIREPLSVEEEAERGREMAALLRKAKVLEAQKKEAAKDFKERIDGLVNRAQRLGEEIEEGRDEVVPVEVHRYWAQNLRVVVRTDGDQPVVVTYRALKGDERAALRQAELPVADADQDAQDVACGACGTIPADCQDADGGPLCVGCRDDMTAEQEAPQAPRGKTCAVCLYLDEETDQDDPRCAHDRDESVSVSPDKVACEHFVPGEAPDRPPCGVCDHFKPGDPPTCIEGEEACETDEACRDYRPKEPGEPAEEPTTALGDKRCGDCDELDPIAQHCHKMGESKDAAIPACDHFIARVIRCGGCRAMAESGDCSYEVPGVTADTPVGDCKRYAARVADALAAVRGAPVPGSPADTPRRPAAPSRPEGVQP